RRRARARGGGSGGREARRQPLDHRRAHPRRRLGKAAGSDSVAGRRTRARISGLRTTKGPAQRALVVFGVTKRSAALALAVAVATRIAMLSALPRRHGARARSRTRT